jgi:uncharacterized protein
MPRPIIPRRISYRGGVSYFKPSGIPLRELDEIILTNEEVEALRLKDVEGLSQTEASKKMNISQPTFFRIINTARKKVSDAIVNGKAIRVQGGTYHFDVNVGKRFRG